MKFGGGFVEFGARKRVEAGFFDKSEAKMVTNLHILRRNLAKNAIGNNKVTKLARYSQKSGGFRIKMRPKNALERAVSNAARGLANSVHGMHKICAAAACCTELHALARAVVPRPSSRALACLAGEAAGCRRPLKILTFLSAAATAPRPKFLPAKRRSARCRCPLRGRFIMAAQRDFRRIK